MRSSINKKFVQIGAGLSTGPSWISYDSSPTLVLSKFPILGRLILKLLKGSNWPHDTRCGDIISGLPLQKNSCKLIFCSHMLEHLSLPDFEVVIRNIYNYLEPGGTFRFIVPDLEVYAKRYIEKITQSRNTAAIDFIKETHLGGENSRRGFASRLREALANSRHQWLWDKYSLMGFLEHQGFLDIRQCQFGEWSDPHFLEVEDEGRHIDSICIECRK